MGLLEDVHAAAAATKRGPACSFASLNLDDDDRADLDRLLADASIPSKAIASALQSRGADIKTQTVARHRKRECRCA